MKLQRVKVTSYRSLYDFQPGAKPFEMDLADGMNLLIGPNNCGKSNIVRAIELALEPNTNINADADLPSNAARARPAVELTFQVAPDDAASDLVRKVAKLREHSTAKRSTGTPETLVLRVRFDRDGDRGGFRRITDFGFDVHLEASDELRKAVALFYQRVRFVITRSGESLESILEGKFREVLRDVVKETLQAEYEQAITRRDTYLDDLQAALFGPLTKQVSSDLAAIFPEVNNVELRPNIPEIDATIANLSIQVADTAITDLAAKGTGLRGGVIAAMFRYLAQHSHHSMVFAVEEPESFLHPAAQEGLRESLEHLAERDEITVIATTHSPFMVPKRPDAKLIAIAKSASGTTSIDAEARGDEPQATLIGGLFRDPQISYVLDAVAQIPPTATAILVVEGTTDVTFLRTAASALQRSSLEGVHLLASTGASAAAAQAVVVQAATDRTVCTLFDNDGNGRAAYDRLSSSTFAKAIRSRSALNYRVAFPKQNADLPYEAEDLFAKEFQVAFSLRHPGIVEVGEHAPGIAHLEFPYTMKDAFASFVEGYAEAADCERWHHVFDALDQALGRPAEERQPIPARTSASVVVDRSPESDPTDRSGTAEPPRRPTPLESLLNGASAAARRTKELLDQWAAAAGLEVVPMGKSYAYTANERPVTRLWPEYGAIDVPFDHLVDTPSGDEMRAKVSKLIGKDVAVDTKKRQVSCDLVLDEWDWLVEHILEPKMRKLEEQ